MNVYKSADVSIRIDPSNPDHHLYNNNGVWWVHYTRYPTTHTARRERRSLETSDLLRARKRRDLLFATLFPEKRRNTLQVYFYPAKEQIIRIENLAVELVELPIDELISTYNQLALKGMSEACSEWIRLSAIRLALHHHFEDPVVIYENGMISTPCLIDPRDNGTLIKYPFIPSTIPQEETLLK